MRSAPCMRPAAVCVRDGTYLFRPPAGLADGLALKELALPSKRDSPQTVGPPLRFRGFGVRRRVAIAAAVEYSPRPRGDKPLVAICTINALRPPPYVHLTAWKL